MKKTTIKMLNKADLCESNEGAWSMGTIKAGKVIEVTVDARISKEDHKKYPKQYTKWCIGHPYDVSFDLGPITFGLTAGQYKYRQFIDLNHATPEKMKHFFPDAARKIEEMWDTVHAEYHMSGGANVYSGPGADQYAATYGIPVEYACKIWGIDHPKEQAKEESLLELLEAREGLEALLAQDRYNNKLIAALSTINRMIMLKTIESGKKYLNKLK